MIVHDVRNKIFHFRRRRSATKYMNEKFFTIASNQKLNPKKAWTQKIAISLASRNGCPLKAFSGGAGACKTCNKIPDRIIVE